MPPQGNVGARPARLSLLSVETVICFSLRKLLVFLNLHAHDEDKNHKETNKGKSIMNECVGVCVSYIPCYYYYVSFRLAKVINVIMISPEKKAYCMSSSFNFSSLFPCIGVLFFGENTKNMLSTS